MKMTGADVYNVLANTGVDTRHHANGVVTGCTFQHLKGLASRAYVEEKCSWVFVDVPGIERLLTARTMLRLQKHTVLEWLSQALGAYRRGLPAPSLLPV
jgi:hypothetical protein